ncbi:hypothetical protein, partial [Streptomyces sp. S3(2020)]|uniref:hypothetical protein n=1 Tax=Streptomyces sp. S3(2020) TaxID=2732044 RepID=UPI001F10BEC1
MAFGVEELRVLRRALALALHPRTASAEDVQDCLRLADSLDEAMREGARLRAFLVADLARYRAALPGTAAGYLTLLEEALSAGYRPEVDDLAALRALRGNPVAAALLDRCLVLAEQDVRARLARGTARRTAPAVPASRRPRPSCSAMTRQRSWRAPPTGLPRTARPPARSSTSRPQPAPRATSRRLRQPAPLPGSPARCPERSAPTAAPSPAPPPT